MKPFQLLILALLALALFASPINTASAQSERDEAVALSFSTLDVYIHTDQGLGAWQVEVDAEKAGGKIVGVEGGDGVYAEPPYYDPKALQGGRIVLAGFSLNGKLPRGKVKVATLHLQEAGDGAPFESRLVVAADGDGKALNADLSVVRP
jgi:hypothetical protein